MNILEQLTLLKPGDKVAVWDMGSYNLVKFSIYEVERVMKTRLALKGTETWVSLITGMAKPKYGNDTTARPLTPNLKEQYDEAVAEKAARDVIRPKFDAVLVELKRSSVRAEMMTAVVEAYEQVTKEEIE